MMDFTTVPILDLLVRSGVSSAQDLMALRTLSQKHRNFVTKNVTYVDIEVCGALLRVSFSCCRR